MSASNLKSILSQLAILTAERDSSSLELVMVQTLFNLATPNAVVIYRVLDAENGNFAISQMSGDPQWKSISEPLKKEMRACVQAKISHTIFRDGLTTKSLYPLLNSKNEALAIIMIDSPETKPQIQELISILLNIYQNFIGLMSENERDTLTGLLNRKTFEMKINKILTQQISAIGANGRDRRKPHYLAIFDIDHFKRVNDTFGHLLGDEVLLLFSRLMVQTFRDHDALFRFGGEEFIGLFQAANANEIMQILERFRSNVAQFSFPQIGQVTVSIGYTQIHPVDVSSVMIDRADAALYYAKSNGRNRVCSHETLIKIGQLAETKIEGEIELF